MAKFKFAVSVDASTDIVTARVGSAADLAGRLVDDDKGKFVSLAGDSQYDLCAEAGVIEGVFMALEPATQDAWAIGSVRKNGRVNAICDGLQGTIGTGAIAIGDYVVAGTVVAAGTALTTAPQVAKATDQTATPMMWRVVSLGDAGAVGDTCVIERV